jgi:predicted RNase H-like HicB family nuclease
MSDWPSKTPSSYSELTVTVRVLYHQELEGWWAESPDIDGWTVAGDSYDEVRHLVIDGITFALAGAAEERGDAFDEARFAGVTIEHYVPAPA